MQPPLSGGGDAPHCLRPARRPAAQARSARRPASAVSRPPGSSGSSSAAARPRPYSSSKHRSGITSSGISGARPVARSAISYSTASGSRAQPGIADQQVHMLGGVEQPIGHRRPLAGRLHELVVGPQRSPAGGLDAPPPLIGRLSALLVRHAFLRQRVARRDCGAHDGNDQRLRKERPQPRDAHGVVGVLVEDHRATVRREVEPFPHDRADRLGGIGGLQRVAVLAAVPLIEGADWILRGGEGRDVAPERIGLAAERVDGDAGVLQEPEERLVPDFCSPTIRIGRRGVAAVIASRACLTPDLCTHRGHPADRLDTGRRGAHGAAPSVRLS